MGQGARQIRAGWVICLAVLGALALPTSAGAFVYWTTNSGFSTQKSAIARANLDGSAVNKHFIPGISACGVAVDGAHIHWADFYWASRSEAIGRANLDGSAVNKRFITGLGFTCGIAVDGAHVYWATTSTPRPVGLDGYFVRSAIGRANLGGSAVNWSFIPVGQGVEGLAGLFAVGNGACGVAIDDTHIYWTNSDAGTIARANLDGSAVNQSLISGAVNPCGVAVDGAHLYWANHDGNTIGRANLDGSAVDQAFITGAVGPYGVALDGAHLYWTNARGNTIGRANLDGSAVNQRFITGAGGPMGVAVDKLRPSNSFTLAKPKLNKHKGTATLVATVPEPGKLALTGRGVKKQTKKVRSAGRVKLVVKAAKKVARKLKRTGKARLTARVTYTPKGGNPRTKSRKVTLKKPSR